MIDPPDVARLLHELGACVLIGTDAGLAVVMLTAHQSKDAMNIAHTSAIVITADPISTTQRQLPSRSPGRSLPMLSVGN